MKKSLAAGRTIGVVVALACIAGAAPVALAADKQPPNPKFTKLDQNKDGYLTREEVVNIPGYQKAFTAADDDRDGKLNPGEFIKAESNYDRTRAATYASDTAITTKVKTALLKAPALKSLDVSVETYDGQVLLSGFVRNAEQRDRAIQVASSVQGVTEVKNALVVR